MDSRIIRTILLARVVSGVVVTAQQDPIQNVTYEQILAGQKDPTRWLTFSGDYTGQRHSPLRQIPPQNVASLAPQWIFQTQTPAPGRGMETTPLVADGVIYVTGIANEAYAIDARTGRRIWAYKR